MALTSRAHFTNETMKTCANPKCNKLFVPSISPGKEARFCCGRCYRSFAASQRRPRVKRTLKRCEYPKCDNEFMGRPDQKFCCVRCRSRNTDMLRNSYRKRRKPKPPVVRQTERRTVTWQHSSPIAKWQLTGEVIRQVGSHYVVFANGCRFEVRDDAIQL